MWQDAGLVQAPPLDSRSVSRRPAQAAVGPVLVSAAYYLGAQIGFALQSPNAPQSVLWLPNSILLAVLLIVPFRRWPVYLAAAFPAQMLVAAGAGAPPLTMALLFLTNCADASLGALLVRRITRSTRPFVFNGLATTMIFIAFGATLPTVLLSFADAGISVATGWSDSYYAAFVTRARSNVLTHLIVVPAIVDLAARDWRRVGGADVVKAAVLTGLLLVTCSIAFSRSAGSQAFAAVLYTPLPLLLWAAFRFGPGGVGWAALVVSVVASWNVLNDRGPFSARSPLEEVVSVQLFLLATTLPLLCLSAVIRERDRASLAVRTSESALRDSYGRVRELAGKLITAQDLERSRIARDIHDDLGQQLAALSMSISALRRNSIQSPELNDALRGLHDGTCAVVDHVRNLSHDLHPATLEHVGLIGALRAHCADVARKNRLGIRFSADEALGPLPRDVAVCLYRVAQEGLRNVASHAGVQDATVSLTQTADVVELTISDRGRGFDQDGAAARRGLGLLSIEERVRLVGGTFRVTSTPERGTTLHVQVPARATGVPKDAVSSDGAAVSEPLFWRDDDDRTA
jgi:signal transduction histidine kinase